MVLEFPGVCGVTQQHTVSLVGAPGTLYRVVFQKIDDDLWPMVVPTPPGPVALMVGAMIAILTAFAATSVEPFIYFQF